MWSFLKRTLSHKTGKGALTLITGSVLNSFFGADISAKVTPVVGETVSALTSGVFSPISIGLGVLGMFLRDGAAKKGE